MREGGRMYSQTPTSQPQPLCASLPPAPRGAIPYFLVYNFVHLIHHNLILNRTSLAGAATVVDLAAPRAPRRRGRLTTHVVTARVARVCAGEGLEHRVGALLLLRVHGRRTRGPVREVLMRCDGLCVSR